MVTLDENGNANTISVDRVMLTPYNAHSCDKMDGKIHTQHTINWRNEDETDNNKASIGGKFPI